MTEEIRQIRMEPVTRKMPDGSTVKVVPEAVRGGVVPLREWTSPDGAIYREHIQWLAETCKGYSSEIELVAFTYFTKNNEPVPESTWDI